MQIDFANYSKLFKILPQFDNDVKIKVIKIDIALNIALNQNKPRRSCSCKHTPFFIINVKIFDFSLSFSAGNCLIFKFQNRFDKFNRFFHIEIRVRYWPKVIG